MKYRFFALFFCLTLSVVAQNKITGHLFCENSDDLYGIVVTLHPDSVSRKTLAYSISDDHGNFVIKYDGDWLNKVIRLRSIAFHDTAIVVDRSKSPLKIQLRPEWMKIKEVDVKGTPVVRYGDTTTYVTSAFVRKKDFSIAEAINRMPGMEVTDDGKVVYQGLPIEKFYIEGSDLMGDGYGTVNKNLPHRSVASVQVLHNHQSKKILEDKITTDATSLNIKLKKAVTVTGRGEVGSGYKPWARYVNLSPMTFTKRYQMVNSLQSNNMGEGLYRYATIVSRVGNKTEGLERLYFPHLGIPSMSEPMVSQERYLDNDDHYISLNGLLKLNGGTELKINGGYVDSEITQSQQNSRSYYLEENPLLIDERYGNVYDKQMGHIDLTLKRNLKHIYMENKLGFVQYWDKEKAEIVSDDLQFITSGSPHKSIYNVFNAVVPVGSSFLELTSKIDLGETKESLSFMPTVHHDLFQDGSEVSVEKQEMDTRSLVVENEGRLGKKYGSILIQGAGGLDYEMQQCQTRMFTPKGEVSKRGYANDLEWGKLDAYLSPSFTYENKGLKVELSTPLHYLLLSTEDKLYDATLDKQVWLFSPELFASYAISPYWKVKGRFLHQRSLNDPISMLRGNVVYDHRTMNSSRSTIYEKARQNYSLRWEYDNALKGWSGFIRGYYNRTFNDFITQKEMVSKGIFRDMVVRKDNEPLLWGASTEVGYYWFGQKLDFSLGGDMIKQKSYYLSSGLLKQMDLSTYKGDVQIGIAKWSAIGLDYKGSYTVGVQKSNGFDSRYTQQSHQSQICFYITKHQWFNFVTEYNIFKQKGFETQKALFSDVIYTFKPKGRFRFHFEARNIFDCQDLYLVHSDAYSVSKSVFKLRPRQFILKVQVSMGKH